MMLVLLAAWFALTSAVAFGLVSLVIRRVFR